jgi:hypothetical protein
MAIPHQVEAETFVKNNQIISRAAWGARVSKVDATKPENLDWDYDTLVIHHSGRSGEDDPQKIQKKHMDERQWDDIGYHFMIEGSGKIYEGRALYFKGAHVEGANTGKIGILIMGNFETLAFGFGGSDPTPLQLQSVKSLGTALKGLFATIKVLGGHKDFKKTTACPGDRLYPLLGGLRTTLTLSAPPP